MHGQNAAVEPVGKADYVSLLLVGKGPQDPRHIPRDRVVGLVGQFGGIVTKVVAVGLHCFIAQQQRRRERPRGPQQGRPVRAEAQGARAGSRLEGQRETEPVFRRAGGLLVRGWPPEPDQNLQRERGQYHRRHDQPRQAQRAGHLSRQHAQCRRQAQYQHRRQHKRCRP